MNDHDDRLRARLHARADTLAPTEDWDDLTRRIARRGRRPLHGLVIAFVLVCGVAIAAVAVGIRGDAQPESVVTRATPRDRVVVNHGRRPTLPASVLGGLSPGGFASMAPITRNGAPIARNGPFKGPICCSDLKELVNRDVALSRAFVRTTAGGTTIRVYRADVDAPSTAGPPWWTPPGWCFPSGVVQADVSDAAISGVVAGGVYAQLRDAVVGGAASVVGTAEQHPTWVVVVQAPANAASVRATFPSGATDAMTPVDGVAVLVGPAAAGDVAGSASVKVEALDAGGAVLGAHTLGNELGAEYSLTAGSQADCYAPQQLPPPGVEQPADATAAQHAVTDVMVRAWGHRGTDQERFALYDDSHGFDQVMQELRTGSFKDQVNAAVVPKVDGVVFLSATRAAIEFTIVVPNYSSFSQRFGEAVLVDGVWKLTRRTFCDAVALASVQCPT